jgi:hypothetical protein
MARRQAVAPLHEQVRAAIQELEDASASVAADAVQIWAPLPAQPGRGFDMPDGRVLSPQELAIESFADELFFGGGPGGGKSQLAMGLAMTRHKNSIIFRREFTQFSGAEGLIAVAQEIVGLRDRYNANKHMFENLPGGRKLEFGQTGSSIVDWLKWSGRPHDLKAFDEIPEIPEGAYRLLIAWLRTSREGQRTRVVGTGNPPLTSEGEWVIRYWAPWLDLRHPDPAGPGELRWFVTDDNDVDREVPGPKFGAGRPPVVVFGGDIKCKHDTTSNPMKCPECGGRIAWPRSRTFIPSSVEDNPTYMKTGYARVLGGLSGGFRNLGSGNFGASIQDHPRQVIPTDWVLKAQARWTEDGKGSWPLTQVGIDPSWGGGDEFVIAKRYGPWFEEPIAQRSTGMRTGPEGAQHVATHVPNKDVRIQIDSDSEGASTKDSLVGLGYKKVIGLHGGHGTDSTDSTGEIRFANKRSKWHWLFRELLDPSKGHDIALPPDPQMRADLCAARYEHSVRGIRVEPKEDIKKRIGRSPDRGEGVIYAGIEEREVEPEKPVAGVWGGARNPKAQPRR